MVIWGIVKNLITDIEEEIWIALAWYGNKGGYETWIYVYKWYVICYSAFTNSDMTLIVIDMMI